MAGEVTITEDGVEEIGADLATTTSLFGTDNPAEVIKRATDVANALAEVIRDRNLYVQIQGKPHITIEGWQTLGAMLGVTPVCEWTRPMENGWEARVAVRTFDGRTIGAAESECLTTESRWKKADDYAVRSMAQTRASSKALASVLRFVVILRGYSGTPAEEAIEGAATEQREPEPEFVPDPAFDTGRAEILALYEKTTKGKTALRRELPKAQLKAQLDGAASDDDLAELRAKVEALKEAA